MSLIRFLYDLRPFVFHPPPFHRIGLGFTPAELQAFFQLPRFRIRPDFHYEEISPAKIDKDGFKVAVNMKDFKPDEIVVKTVDNTVVIEGKCERKDEKEGFISREFVRKYVLPENYDVNKVESTLTSDGVLTVSAPSPPANERIVKINQIEKKGESVNKESSNES